jgi:hypothetical protein
LIWPSSLFDVIYIGYYFVCFYHCRLGLALLSWLP